MPLVESATIAEKVLLVDIGGTLVEIGEEFSTYTNSALENIYPCFDTEYSKDSFVLTAMAIRNDIRKHAYRTCTEWPFDDFIRRIVSETHAKTRATKTNIEERYVEAELSISRTFDDVLPFLQRAKRAGRRIVAATNNFSSLHVFMLLNRFGLDVYFDKLYVSGTMKIRKPAAGFLETILSREKVERKDCVMIGDKPEIDVQAGINARVRTVWLNRNASQSNVKAGLEVKDLNALTF